MQIMIAVLVASTMLVQAPAVKPMSDAQRDGLKAGARTVTTAIERSPGVTEPVEDATYDEQGRLTKRVTYDRGAVLSTSTFEHLDGGVRIESRTYANRPPVTRLEPKNGRKPPRFFDESGAELFCRTVTFDAAGRPLAEFTYTGREPMKHPAIARVVYQYQRGKPSATTYFERYPEVQVRRDVFVFDTKGAWTETIVYEPNQPSPEKRTWTDTLDPLENWTRRVERRLRAGQEVIVTYVRTITY